MIVALAFLKRAWPYLLAAVIALAFAGAVFAAYRHGVAVEHERMRGDHAMEMFKQEQAHKIALIEQADKLAAQIAAVQDIARLNLAEQAQLQATFDSLTEQAGAYEHSRPNDGLRDCLPGADWLRIWNDANRGATGAAADRP